MNLKAKQHQLVALLTTQLAQQLTKPIILSYKPNQNGTVTGKVRDGDRVFNFVVKGYKASIKPSGNMDSELFSSLYLRLDGTRSNPTCGKATYACKGDKGIGCIPLTKVCERDEKSSIGKERLNKIKDLSSGIAEEIAKLNSVAETDPVAAMEQVRPLRREQRKVVALESEILKQRDDKAKGLKSKRAFDRYVAIGETYLRNNGVDSLFDDSPNPLTNNIKVNEYVMTSQSETLVSHSRSLVDKTINSFFNLSNGKGSKSFKVLERTSPRGYANPNGIINIGHVKTESEFKSTLFHEMAHHIEFENPLAKLAAQHFVRSRAIGEQKRLSDLTGNTFYQSDEKAYPDKFIDPYVGKIYDDGSTEVLSMGIEQFNDKKALAKFRKEDPEHFLFVLGVLKS